MAELCKRWVDENLGSIVSRFVRQWLELPICSPLSSLILSTSRTEILTFLLSQVQFLLFVISILHLQNAVVRNRAKE